MSTSRQVPSSKLPASRADGEEAAAPERGPAVVDPATLAVIEQALVTMRRDQTRRRLQRRAEHAEGHVRGEGHHGGPRGHRRGELGNAAKFRLLDALAASDRALSISELGEAIGVDQPRASRLVAAAAEDGLLRRTADPVDARRSVIELSGAGRRVLEEAHGTRRQSVAEALAGFSAEEAEQFGGLLARFVEAWPRERS